MPLNARRLLILGALAGAASFLTAHAQDEEAGPYDAQIQYRQALMKSIGGHVVASASLVSGKIAAPGHLKVHAAAIAGASDDVKRFFPEGSTDEDSAAKPEIWQSWDTFAKRADEMHEAALVYHRAVQSDAATSDVQASFKKLTETCKACHEDYRRKD
jgi:cytochrome c556